MFGNIWNKMFGGASMPKGEEEKLKSMMEKPEMQKIMAVLQSRLSKEDQKQLFRLAMSRNPEAVQKFLAEKIPDFEDIVRSSMQ